MQDRIGHPLLHFLRNPAFREPPYASHSPDYVTEVTKVTELAEKSGRNPRNDAESRAVVGTFKAVERPTGVSPSKSTRCDGPSSLEE